MKKVITPYDLRLIFDMAVKEYNNCPNALESKEQRAYSFVKAVTTYLQDESVDYSELVRKNVESVFED